MVTKLFTVDPKEICPVELISIFLYAVDNLHMSKFVKLSIINCVGTSYVEQFKWYVAHKIL